MTFGRPLTHTEQVINDLLQRAANGDADAQRELIELTAKPRTGSMFDQPELDDEQMPAAWRPRLPFRVRAGLWALRVGLRIREHAADILYFVVLGVLLYLVGRFLPAPPPR